MIILVGLIVLSIVLMVLKKIGSRKPAPLVRPIAAVERSRDSPVVVPLSNGRLSLRLPETLRDRLAAAAARKDRSLSAEIVARLEASLADEEGS